MSTFNDLRTQDTYTLAEFSTFVKDDITGFEKIKEEKEEKPMVVPSEFDLRRLNLNNTMDYTDIQLQEPSQKVGTLGLEEKDVAKKIPQKDQQYSVAYRKLKRKPLLTEILSIINDFRSALGTIDSARHYTLLKGKINQLWEYTGSDEYFAMALATLDSVTRFNRWRDFNQRQTQELARIIDILINKEVELKDIRTITISLTHAKLNLFPFENYHEEKEKEKN